MARIFNDSFVTLAEELIDFFGQDVVFTQTTNTGYNTDTLTYDNTSSQDFTVTAAILQMTRNSFELSEKIGLAITQNMKQVWIASGVYIPAIGDICTDGAVNYRVQNIEEYKTQGVPAAYLLFVGA